jgi:hypothetical protein
MGSLRRLPLLLTFVQVAQCCTDCIINLQRHTALLICEQAPQRLQSLPG